MGNSLVLCRVWGCCEWSGEVRSCFRVRSLPIPPWPLPAPLCPRPTVDARVQKDLFPWSCHLKRRFLICGGRLPCSKAAPHPHPDPRSGAPPPALQRSYPKPRLPSAAHTVPGRVWTARPWSLLWEGVKWVNLSRSSVTPAMGEMRGQL